MTQAARVFSVEDIEALHASLARFGAQGQEALSTAELEIRRCIEGIEGRLDYWQREVGRRQEDLQRARADLAHARAMREDMRGGTADKELALARAQHRLREAEDKVVMCRRWLRQVPDVVKEYEGYARVLAGMLDANLKQSLAMLADKINILKTYAGTGPPGTPEGAPAAAPAPAPAAEPATPPAEGSP
jgi:hypothetical protein